jgi:hypothetical protein
MFTRNNYYIERPHIQLEIAQAAQYRMVQSASESCESNVTKMSIRMLDAVGSRLVQWGSKLQCRCAEMAMTASKRAIL